MLEPSTAFAVALVKSGSVAAAWGFAARVSLLPDPAARMNCRTDAEDAVAARAAAPIPTKPSKVKSLAGLVLSEMLCVINEWAEEKWELILIESS